VAQGDNYFICSYLLVADGSVDSQGSRHSVKQKIILISLTGMKEKYILKRHLCDHYGGQESLFQYTEEHGSHLDY
jgi:hypothetical protein